ncbi:unnamed protein product [Urochloa humidicola]
MGSRSSSCCFFNGRSALLRWPTAALWWEARPSPGRPFRHWRMALPQRSGADLELPPAGGEIPPLLMAAPLLGRTCLLEARWPLVSGGGGDYRGGNEVLAKAWCLLAGQ